MPPRLAPAVADALDRDISAALLNLNQRTMHMIATNHHCSYETVRHHKVRIEAGLPRPVRSGGPIRVIDKEMETAIHYLLDKFPWFYQDEISNFLREVYDIEVH